MLYLALHDQQMGQKGIKKVFSPQMKTNFYLFSQTIGRKGGQLVCGQ